VKQHPIVRTSAGEKINSWVGAPLRSGDVFRALAGRLAGDPPQRRAARRLGVPKLEHARKSQVVEIEASQRAEDAWTQHVSDVAMKSLFARADTQYVGSNIPGKPRVYLAYLGGVGVYRKTCDKVRDNGYEGFVLRTASGALPGSETWSAANEIPLVWGTAV
jgi:hypothetical protein